MKLQLVKPSAAAAIGLLLTAPAVYFIFISVLKYILGWPALFDASEPFLNSLGANQPLGWNINLLLVFGPLLAFLLNVTSLLTIQWSHSETTWNISFSIQRKLLNWLVTGLSAGTLLVLFLYALGENFRC